MHGDVPRSISELAELHDVSKRKVHLDSENRPNSSGGFKSHEGGKAVTNRDLSSINTIYFNFPRRLPGLIL